MKSEEFVKLMVESAKKKDEQIAIDTINGFYKGVSMRVAEAINGYVCDLSAPIVEACLRGYADAIKSNAEGNGLYSEVKEIIDECQYTVGVMKVPMA